MIWIKPLNRAGLLAYLESEEYASSTFVPISRHRAHSHYHNPRVEEEDIIMILAYSEKVLVGYLGVLADWIFENDGSKHKCGWLSCMWIDPGYRGRGISKTLVANAFEFWDDNILVTEFTPAAKGLYDKIGRFRDLAVSSGTRLYFRFDLAKILPPKKPIYKGISGLLSILDIITNVPVDLRYLVNPSKPGGVTIEPIDHLDKEMTAFIEERKLNYLFRRGASEIEWTMKYPWVLSSPAPDQEGSRYHFSSVARDFSFIPLELKNQDGLLLAFMLFAKRDRNLKLPYCYYENGAVGWILDTIKYFIKKWRINTFTVFHKELADGLMVNPTGAIYKKNVVRHYIISKNIRNVDEDRSHLIQDGDADCAFT